MFDLMQELEKLIITTFDEVKHAHPPRARFSMLVFRSAQAIDLVKVM
jgi:hypothetical protein